MPSYSRPQLQTLSNIQQVRKTVFSTVGPLANTAVLGNRKRTQMLNQTSACENNSGNLLQPVNLSITSARQQPKQHEENTSSLLTVATSPLHNHNRSGLTVAS